MIQSINRQRKNILWLASWYPNKEDHFTGDFIQRHAKAAALVNNIYVLHVAPSDNINAQVEETINIQLGLTEHIIYFRQTKTVWGKFAKQVTWFKLYQKAIQLYIKKTGLPKTVHVHVAWKTGLIALWLKYRYKLPYIITEHWGIYNRIVADNFFKKPLCVKFLIKKIFKESAHLATVSYFIASHIKTWMKNPKITLTPNVVDTNLFFPVPNRNNIFTFIHVSTLIPLKNVKGILNAFNSLYGNPAFDYIQLIIIGNKDDTYLEFAKSIGISHKVIFKGEISYAEVAKEMKNCHCLIINSIMENAPCVISEAHCCGLPVIATKVGGIPEMIDQENGITIDPYNDNELAKGILNIFENFSSYDQNNIAIKASRKYAFETVALQFDLIYTHL